MNHRVVITGIGCITPYGEGADIFFKGIASGLPALKAPSLFSDPLLECQVVGEVPDFSPEKFVSAKDLKRVPRIVPMAVGAAREALASAGIDTASLDEDGRRRIGVIIGTGGGGIEFAERQYEEFFAKNNTRHVTPYCVSSSLVGMLSSEISIALGLHGISHVISTGCTSSTDAMGYAYQMIRSGQEPMLLTGGAEACITRGLMAGFCQMRIVSTRYNAEPGRASRPFDKDRDGFVLAEGAWLFVMESLESAKARGAKVYAEITGYGSTCDAYHRVAAKQDGIEPARAITLALTRAKIAPEAVDCIQLHGTSTAMNDAVETRAVKIAFNGSARSVSTTALKSLIGHAQGACGAASVLSGIYSLENQFIAPTANLETPDPECDLDYTPNEGRKKKVRRVLCNTIAFGSKNSAIVLEKI